MKMRVASNILATWVGVGAAIAGGYAALQQYQEDVSKKVDQRQLQTFGLVETFMSRDFVPIREKVTRYVRARRTCDSQPYQGFGLTDTDLFTYLEFFDYADACLEADLCDRETVARFFAPYAADQWPVLEEYVKAVRAAETTPKAAPFGLGMERLAGAGGAGPSCP